MTGTESFFVRTSGCNLRCWFCDTPYASWHPSGQVQSVDSIVQAVIDSGLGHVVLTGGEPLLFKETPALCRLLHESGLHITIETAGTVDQVAACDLMSISPKFQSSAPDASKHPQWHALHQQRRLPLDTMRQLIDRSEDFQLKFVVDSPADYDELLQVVDCLDAPPTEVWVMPQGSTIEALDGAAQWLKPWCESNGFRYCDRMQIRWFGNRRGT